MGKPGDHWPTTVQELLLDVALLDAEPARDAWRRWNELVTVEGADHDSGRLFPLVYRRLVDHGVAGSELTLLKSAYRHQWVAAQQRFDRAGAALRALAAAGVETMVLKGAALAEPYYGDVGLRPMYDVDILVRGEHVLAAVGALGAAGWRPRGHGGIDGLLPVQHAIELVDDVDVAIDLHWHPLWAPCSEAELWAAAEPIEVGGAPTRSPCPADQLLLICVHGLWSYGHRLRWITDAVTLLRATPAMDWDRVVRQARARRLTVPVREALAYVRDRFGAAVPAAVIDALRRAPGDRLDRVEHRLWMSRQTPWRTAALVVARYRRQRSLPAGPTRAPSFWAYLRGYAAMAWHVESVTRLVLHVALRPFRPGRPARARPR